MAIFYHLEMGNETETRHYELGVGVPDVEREGASEDQIETMHEAARAAIVSFVGLKKQQHPDLELVRWWTENDKGEKLEISTELPDLE